MKRVHQEPTFADTTVLVTGVCGTVGRELLRQLSENAGTRIVGIDNNESGIFHLTEKYGASDNVELFICDIRDKDGLLKRTRNVDSIIHAAALKHVGVCERSPEDAIRTNIVGSQNIVDVAYQNRVRKVLFTSSDKAVNPTNVMGTSKLMGERLFTAAHSQRRNDIDPVFSTTRFGNVLGSSGSVVPLFSQQIRDGGPVTLTDPRMTRFIMSLSDAVSLVLESFHLATGGEVFITKMPVAKIIDIAEILISDWKTNQNPYNDVDINVIGPRPGEKMFEELLSEEEGRRTIELNEFLVVYPTDESIPANGNMPADLKNHSDLVGPYNSAKQAPLEKSELSDILRRAHLLGPGPEATGVELTDGEASIEDILVIEPDPDSKVGVTV